ncbi:MAG: DUF2071 domain-containing protein [Fimbriimonas sp.]
MLPTIAGIIARRLLVNFRVDPEVAQQHLPSGVRLKLHKGYGVAGICLIRLERMHPAFLPLSVGLSSENAAHRYAVTYRSENGETDGVYIPRRDTNSRLTQLLGGKLVPGTHHAATFQVDDHDGRIGFAMDSDDEESRVRVVGTESVKLPSSSIFESLDESSTFFEGGASGLSDRAQSDGHDQVELVIDGWEVRPFDVEMVQSSYFDDENRFPTGSAVFDHALIMRDMRHQWRSRARYVASHR